MPRKFALLIGVSEYGEGFEPLSAPPNDVAALQQVLQNPDLGGFDPANVKTLINPGPIEMQQYILDLFSQSRKDDLILLFFSGHGITNDDNHLYFCTRQTSKADYLATAVPARFIQGLSNNLNYAKRQVMILDCCYSGAFAEGWRRKGDIKVELERELGKEGRVVLTSSSATQVSFQQEDAALSLYTQYLVEGIETGAADTDRDGEVKVRELHDYAKRKVQEAKPKMKPDIIVADDQGYDVLLSRVRINRELRFRQAVEECVDHDQGDILDIDVETLQVRAKRLGLSSEQSQAIVNSVLEPFRRRRRNLKRYQEKYAEFVQRQYPLTARTVERLQIWQQEVLGLEDRDVAHIQQAVNAKKKQELQNARIASQLEEQAKKSVKPSQSPNPSPPPRRPSVSPKGASMSAPAKQPQTLFNQAHSGQTLSGKSSTPSRPFVPVIQSISRRQLLRWGALGGSGLLFAMIFSSLGNQSSSDSQETSAQQDQPSSSIKGPPPPLKDPFTRHLVTEAVTPVKINAEAEIFEEPTVNVDYYDEELDLGSARGLRMVKIPPGKFWMGQTEIETNELKSQMSEEDYQRSYADELPRHQVTVDPFFMSMTPITQAQYQVIMSEGENPAKSYGEKFVDPNKPIVGVSWEDAIAFCEKLSKETEYEYRLPSEAEWEYACRAGTETPFHFGETINTDLANYNGTYTYGSASSGIYRQEITIVRTFPANKFGLFNMHGNVWEWCQDVWHENYDNAPINGRAWEEDGDQSRRVLRGGSWLSYPRGCRSAVRYGYGADYRVNDIGFRVVCSPPRALS